MKKVLLIIGILSIIVFIVFLLLALINMHGYYNLFDGTAEHYKRLHQRMTTSFIISIISAIIGALSFIIHSKI